MALRQIRAGAMIAGYDPRTHIYQNAAYQPPPGGAIRVPAPQPVKDQNWPASRVNPVVPCCVSCAIISAVEYLRIPGWDTAPLSPLFHYYQARYGMSALTMLDVLAGLRMLFSAGVCLQSWHDVPMDPAGARLQPSPEATNNATALSIALRAQGIQYASINPVTIPSLQGWISEGYPVVAVISLTESYQRLTSQAPVHGPGSHSTSYHAVLLTGFDEATRTFLVQDSRGSSFVQAGYWYLPYDLLNPESLVAKAWGLRPQLP